MTEVNYTQLSNLAHRFVVAWTAEGVVSETGFNTKSYLNFHADFAARLENLALDEASHAQLVDLIILGLRNAGIEVADA